MKYSQRQAPMSKDSKMFPKIHPIWRGVGFALMVLAPIMAYATSEILLADNANTGWMKIPTDLIVKCPNPDFFGSILCKFSPDPMILVKIIATLVLTLVFLVILQFFYFIVMRLFAPPRYGPLDVPPVTYKGKPYKR